MIDPGLNHKVVLVTGGNVKSWEGNFQEVENINLLFEYAEKTFGNIDIHVNNAAEYTADTFLPAVDSEEISEVWAEGPAISTIDAESHEPLFAANSRAVAGLISKLAHHIIKRQAKWGRIPLAPVSYQVFFYRC
jgi:NAD(P)-dependent dehydrogenase (short-subunit alcohol dehydrogenase family)